MENHGKTDIPCIILPSVKEDLDLLRQTMLPLQAHPVQCVNWPEYSHKPGVIARVAHTGDHLCLLFQVKSDHYRVVYKNDGEPVWKDSCVECFIALDDLHYYNLEFNAAGTALAGFGKGRNMREAMPEMYYKDILRKASGPANIPGTDTSDWELLLLISLRIFWKHNIKKLNGLNARVNFYKCGDDTPVKHYLSWAPVHSASPDFHQPSYFLPARFV